MRSVTVAAPSISRPCPSRFKCAGLDPTHYTRDGPHATGAPRRCTSRAERRALPPSMGAAPDLQRRPRRSDERRMRASASRRSPHRGALVGVSVNKLRLTACAFVRLCATSAVPLAPACLVPVPSARVRPRGLCGISSLAHVAFGQSKAARYRCPSTRS